MPNIPPEVEVRGNDKPRAKRGVYRGCKLMTETEGGFGIHTSKPAVCGRRFLLVLAWISAVSHGPRGGPKCVRVPE